MIGFVESNLEGEFNKGAFQKYRSTSGGASIRINVDMIYYMDLLDGAEASRYHLIV